MNPKILQSLALLSVASAALPGSVIDNAIEGGSILSEKIDAFQGSQGLDGALGIQKTFFPVFSDQVISFKDALADATPEDATIPVAQNIAQLETGIANLLKLLADKGADFKQADAQSIVQLNVKALYGPTIEIANSLLSLADGKCDVIGIVVDGLKDMDSAFSEAATVYDVAPTPFPSPAQCESSSEEPSASSSATETSTSSATETSTSSEEPSASSSATETSTSSEEPSASSSEEPSASSSATETYNEGPETSTVSGQRCLVRPTASEVPVTSAVLLF